MKNTNFGKVVAVLLMAGLMFVLAGNASAQTVTRSYVYSFGSGFERTDRLEEQRRIEQQRRIDAEHRAAAAERRLQQQQAPVINIYNQPQQSYGYTRPHYDNNRYRQPPAYNSRPYHGGGHGYNRNRAPQREVIVVEREHKPMSTKDVAKTAGVLVGLHCIFTGCL